MRQISRWDDYFVHQTRYTLDRWESDDPGAFERLYVLAHNADGTLYVMIGFAIYPNRNIADAGVAIRHNGIQRNIFMSRHLEADQDRAVLSIGPLTVECLEPLNRWRIELGENDYGIGCSLEFEASSIAWPHNEERVEKSFSGGFDQALRFKGSVSLDDKRFSADGFYGGRNHTWGDRRPLGPEITSATFGLDLMFWGFAHFDDCCFLLPVSLTKPGAEDTAGEKTAGSWSDAVLSYRDGRVIPVTGIRHRLELVPDTKWSYSRLELLLQGADGIERHLVATPVSRECYLRGVGYWGRHGTDFGAFHIEGDEYDVSNPVEIGHPLYGANDRVCHFQMDGTPGVGLLENILSDNPAWRYRPTW